MSKVYFISSRADSRERNLTKYHRLLKNIDLGRIVSDGDLVAIKTSFGEQGNVTYLRPQYVRVVVEEVKRLGGRPFLTDANTLYAGGRQNSRDHMITALENGFGYEVTGAPIVIAGGLLGFDYRTVPVNGDHFSEAKIAPAALDADAIISVAHFKGHMICGFGGALKNLGMGFGARAGKQMMHSDVHPEVAADRCDGCARCYKWCPEKAIMMTAGAEGQAHKVAQIDDEACIGCGECVATCFTGAISISWKSDPAIVQQKMVEYAAAALHDKQGKFAALNFIIDVTPDCDCIGWSDNAIVPNIGIAASLDPVSIDAASLDLVNQVQGSAMSALDEAGMASPDKFGSVHKGIDATAQIRHGAKIGLGESNYDLVSLDKDKPEKA
ncbi:MAG: DUF362 domain-containing protein [Thermoleophilia bacterium]